MTYIIGSWSSSSVSQSGNRYIQLRSSFFYWPLLAELLSNSFKKHKAFCSHTSVGTNYQLSVGWSCGALAWYSDHGTFPILSFSNLLSLSEDGSCIIILVGFSVYVGETLCLSLMKPPLLHCRRITLQLNKQQFHDSICLRYNYSIKLADKRKYDYSAVANYIRTKKN